MFWRKGSLEDYTGRGVDDSLDLCLKWQHVVKFAVALQEFTVPKHLCIPQMLKGTLEQSERFSSSTQHHIRHCLSSIAIPWSEKLKVLAKNGVIFAKDVYHTAE
jgi:hypothetical protein